MAKSPSSNMLAKVFVMINAVALNGERCPQLHPHGSLTTEQNRTLLVLARSGKLRVEIFMHNWRVVTICDGPNRGKHTMLPPTAKHPYRVIQKGDVPAGQRPQPSLPQLLTDSRNSDNQETKSWVPKMESAEHGRRNRSAR